MQARYYDPVIGRFYSNDPIGFTGVSTFNRYSYVGNNPYKYTDPTGMARKSSYQKCEDDPNCSNKLARPESRKSAANRIKGEVESNGDFKNKGEADWLYELNDDENLTVTVQSSLMTLEVLSPWRVDSKGGLKADAIIVGGYSVHGQSTIRKRPNGTYGIYDGKYNFEMHAGFSVKTIMRNIATFLASPIGGTPYNINYKGNVGAVIPYKP
jgi:uncharacterized protein RhaS with RHS repeats